MNRLFLFLLLISITSCGVSRLSDKEKNELILGKWHISKKSSAQPFYEIDFRKNGVIFNTTGDTLLAYGYEFVPRNLLKLTDKNHEVYFITIKRLNKKELVVENFFENTTQQTYLREN